MFTKYRIFHKAFIFTFLVFTGLLIMSVVVAYSRAYTGHTGLDMAKMQRMRTMGEAQD